MTTKSKPIASGDRFGELVVVGADRKKNNHTRWLCGCSCGSLTLVWAANLHSGRSRRCRSCHDEWTAVSARDSEGQLIAREHGLPYQRYVGSA
jgi:hypothetical protein